MLVLWYSKPIMKVIKPFFLGVLGGLALALALLTGLFFSPLREKVYFAADPEMADIRSKLDQYQQWLAQTDLRIAANGAAPSGRVSDSLQAAQTKAWRDYKGWRNRLGDLAREHVNPTAEGFWPWLYSLRFWILPLGAALVLLPGLMLAWRARPPFPSARGKAPLKTARAQALSNFEDAIKKVARISESDRGNAPLLPPRAFPGEKRPRSVTGMEPPTETLPSSAFPETFPPEVPPPAPPPKSREPETVPIPRLDDREPASDPGRETRFMEVGPGWGESLNQPGERIGGPGATPANPPSRLAMEDEDVADARAAASEDEDEETLGAMPPTTEVERVERRKDEVLKLARKGMTSSEISRRMRISQDQVEFIIRLRREKG